MLLDLLARSYDAAMEPGVVTHVTADRLIQIVRKSSDRVTLRMEPGVVTHATTDRLIQIVRESSYRMTLP